MKIIEKSHQMNVSELHAMTRANSIKKMESAKGSTLNIDAWVMYEDEKTDKQTGEVSTVTVLSIRDGDEVFATVSPTFKGEFFAIKNMCEDAGEAFDHVIVTTGTSRAGRTFITCAF